jgi:hypothetical protein
MGLVDVGVERRVAVDVNQRGCNPPVAAPARAAPTDHDPRAADDGQKPWASRRP